MTASDLELLAAAARRGTARSALPEPSATALGAALAAVSRDTPEAALLARAALVGLHARAGRLPARATDTAPLFQPTEGVARSAPAAVLALLPTLMSLPPLMQELLQRAAMRGLHLPVTDARLVLEQLGTQGGDPLSGTLWPVLDEVGRWLARLHPVWKRQDPAQASESVQLERLRRELVEAHATDPHAVTADLLTRWPTLKADERRTALNAVAGSLHPADLPLLTLAQRDRLDDVRRLARLLPARLPGPLADEVRAALQALVKLDKKGKLKVGVQDIPAALRDPAPKKGVVEDELALLLGATPVDELAALLGGPDILRLLSEYRSPSGMHSGFADLRQAAAGGASLDALTVLAPSLEMALTAWPQARVRERLWEALDRLLTQKQPDSSLLSATSALLHALIGPLAGAATPPEPGKPGLFQRLRTFVQPAAPDEFTRLHRVFDSLLRHVATELPEQPHIHMHLLAALILQLDPARPLPELPAPPPLPTLDPLKKPSKETLQNVQHQEWQRSNLERQYADLTQLHALRRRIQTLLPGPALSDPTEGAES
ncbi:DUF5691 domain-containing protein [Deinococcus sp. KNUC1210]|uniref:DUF5691 domain-containing protein n=1 Tax=Deinococcus sp. KNUC1210 TaxID=2917691 RepID=UPI001EF14ED5|nr:DUF5691 domain-containing protein [Deinococcus sp. KNUC1210]ULH16170.1 DUF5691 domain-containing protein [Deinococcus sp. KNUC1210]